MADSDEDQTDSGDVEELKAANARELHRAVREEGQEELERPTGSLFWSAVAGGLAITASLIAEAAIAAHSAPSAARPLLIAIGYPIGFLMVILGRMQLFTESTVTAMLPLVSEPSWLALGRTLRLWSVVLGGNLIGTALVALAFATLDLGDPAMRAAMLEVSMKITEHDVLGTFLNAVPAGFLIAIVAWTLPNAREQAFFVVFGIVYVVAIGGFSHSVVGSSEAFLLLFSGKIGVAKALGFLVPAVLGNLFGGAGLFAVLAHAQVREEAA
ncbi:formate/nitrite transporter family protein [Sphingomonas sp. PAMC 26605]|uniref:formate/nitrite transporter family protein n=1 Tax=Sphingomonas sp. PAMC 26605 TaxID=1112214 RepID=UPI00026CD6EF|nr:formate/nitrite transporter family protein [Sphingomonas sp. PAMC 26605]